ncbi:phosphatase PAP2 family protein [Streptomyces sp. NPDC012888]|uniref:phosphatase PAP2 family protein n=1 Tax=Streptomyces sp. NPDC012888 TaxID=3364855 RepID=UPI003680154B
MEIRNLRNGGRWWRAGVGCALLAALLTVLVALRWHPVLRYDGLVARALHAQAHAHPELTALNRLLSDWVWDPWTMRALLAVACGWLWWRGERRLAGWFLLAVAAAAVVSQGVKAAVGRERPVWADPVDTASYAAYPSGHALTATVVCGLLLWLASGSGAGRAGRSGRAGWVTGAAWAVAAVSVLGVGFTRVLLGVHWPSDVVAGWLLGAVLVAFVALAASRRAPVAEPARDQDRSRSQERSRVR